MLVQENEDKVRHGGWWHVKEFQEISGPVAIEIFPFSYILAKDDGTFTFGAPHNEGLLHFSGGLFIRSYPE